MGRLLGLLLARLLPRLPLTLLLALSPFQLPGLRRWDSSLLMPRLGEGVRAGVDTGIRLSSSCITGLSGGVGGGSSAKRGSCMIVSAFSMPSTIS